MGVVELVSYILTTLEAEIAVIGLILLSVISYKRKRYSTLPKPPGGGFFSCH